MFQWIGFRLVNPGVQPKKKQKKQKEYAISSEYFENSDNSRQKSKQTNKQTIEIVLID